MTDEKNLLGMVGLCRSAGKAVIGVPMICDALAERGRKIAANKRKDDGDTDIIVIEASDTSENTHKRITDKCLFYGVMHIRLDSDCVRLGHAVGKVGAVAAVAINDKNFCRAILSKLS